METNNEQWQDKVRSELIEVIDKFLALSTTGGWALKYQHPVKTQYEDGTKTHDTTKVNGVDLFIQFDFENMLVIVKEEEEVKP